MGIDDGAAVGSRRLNNLAQTLERPDQIMQIEEEKN